LVLFIQFGDYNYSYLLLSENGLEYKNLFYRINAKWEDVIKIYRPIFGQLRFSFIDEDHDEYIKLSNSDAQSAIPLISWFITFVNLSKRIPISRFAWNWRSSDLGEILLTNSPKLYDINIDYSS
jgi:hypothetical protein